MSQYIPIRINTLRAGSVPGFEIFVKVADHHVHYLKNTDPIDANRIQKLKDGKVKKLFIPLESEANYLQYLDAGLATLKSGGESTEAKAAMAADVLVTAAENAERTVENEAAFKRAEAQFTKVIDFLMNDRRAIKAILSASGTSLDDFQHAANVTSLSLGACTAAGIKDPKDLLQMGIAGLLHDIGKAKLKLDPLKKVADMSAEERRIYESHAANGAQLLSGKPFITPRILGLIADHEEVGVGKGYPNKKDLAKLQYQYQVFNLANAFDRFCMEQQLSPAKAIDPFYAAKGELFSNELLTVLASVLN